MRPLCLTSPGREDRGGVPSAPVGEPEHAGIGEFELPPLRVRELLLGNGPRFARDAFGPPLAFYVGWKLGGLVVGIAASTVVSLLAFRAERRNDRPGFMVRLSLAVVVIQAVVGLVADSERVYLAQPVLVTGIYGLAFVISVAIGRPLAAKFAGDFYPFPDEVKCSATFRQAFIHHRTGHCGRRWSEVSTRGLSLTTDDALRAEIKQALVRSLRLPIAATEIADDISLFGEGLGLDSIDVLELVLELERTFGASITDEETRQTGAAHGQHDRRVHPGERRPAAPMNILTVDVEEWFHVCGADDALSSTALAGIAQSCGPDDAPAARDARQGRVFGPRFSSLDGSPSGIRRWSAKSWRLDMRWVRTVTGIAACTSSRRRSSRTISRLRFTSSKPPALPDRSRIAHRNGRSMMAHRGRSRNW